MGFLPVDGQHAEIPVVLGHPEAPWRFLDAAEGNEAALFSDVRILPVFHLEREGDFLVADDDVDFPVRRRVPPVTGPGDVVDKSE